MSFTEYFASIYPVIVAILPSVAAVFSIFFAVIKCIKDNKTLVQPIIDGYKELKKEVEDKTELSEVKAQMEAIMVENRQLKKEIADLISAIKKVQYDINSD